jgi:hypothetical protein
MASGLKALSETRDTHFCTDPWRVVSPTTLNMPETSSVFVPSGLSRAAAARAMDGSGSLDAIMARAIRSSIPSKSMAGFIRFSGIRIWARSPGRQMGSPLR